MTSDHHIAGNWPDLREQARGNEGSATNSFLYSYGKLEGGTALGGSAPQFLWAASEALTRGALLHRMDTTAALMPMILPRVGDVAKAIKGKGAKPVQVFLAALAINDLATGGLVTDAPDHAKVFLDQIAKTSPVPPFARRPMAWAFLAHGRAEAARPFLPFKPDDTPARAVELTRNDEDLLVQFYRCIREGADAEIARPAWETWLDVFALMLGVEDSSWPEFLWSARAFHSVISGQPASGLVAWLRDEIP